MKSPTILIIEANRVARKQHRDWLESEHYHVLGAEDGRTALRLARDHPVELILQDLLLPDMTSIELGGKLKATPKNKRTPIIAMSGFLNSSEVQSDCFVSFLLKPITISQLIKAVKVYLPIDKQPKTVRKTQRVLIVEDDPAQLKLLHTQLNYLGYDVILARNGKEALQLMSKNRPDVVVSDIHMPVKDGFELCYDIRKESNWDHIPIIFICMHDITDVDRKLGEKIGASYYLMRTADNQELISTLKKCFKKMAKTSRLQSHEFFKEEHMAHLSRQLNHQININFDLAKQSSLQSAQLSILKGMAHSLAETTQDQGREEILATYLDVAGIPKGILYQWINTKFVLQQSVGFVKRELNALEKVMEETKVFQEISVNKRLLQLQAKDVSNPCEKLFLKKAYVDFALVVPIIVGEKFIGALFLGSNESDLTTEYPTSFAHALGALFGQSMKISSIFAKLTDSENRYRTLMEHASCGILISHLNGHILEVNEEVKKILQCQDEDIIGRSLIDFITEADRPTTHSLLKIIVREGTASVNEIHLKKRDGTHALVEYSAAIVKTKNEKLLLSIITDVTERNKLRMQALLHDRLLITGTLMAGVAHEINNPIAWILSNLNYLKKQFDLLALKDNVMNQDWQTQISNLEEVVTESVHGAERIRDIVRLFKNVGLNVETNTKLLDVHEVLNSAINMASLELKHRAQLVKNFSHTIPLIESNSSQLHQVFLNLIINAAQAIPDGDIEHNTIRVNTVLESEMIRVDIQDTGEGIKPEIIAHIFDPFFSTKPTGTGSGLGLSICYEIMENLGGKISVHSELGKGATFSVYIPTTPLKRSSL